MLCDLDARFVRKQFFSYVNIKVGTKGEGRREPFSCSLRRGGPIGKVLVHRWSPKSHQQSQQGVIDEVVHQSVYISSQLSLLRQVISQERLNRQMEGEKVMIHKYQVYTFPWESI